MKSICKELNIGLLKPDGKLRSPQHLRNLLNIRESTNTIEFPGHLGNKFKEKVEQFKSIVTKIDRKLYYQDEEIRKLYIGRLLYQLINLFETCVKNGEKRFIVSSTHDNTIFALKLALNCACNEWPTFGENIIFEIWQSKENRNYNQTDGQYLVRVLINGVVHEVLQTANSKENEFVDLRHLEQEWKSFMMDENEWTQFCMRKCDAG